MRLRSPSGVGGVAALGAVLLVAAPAGAQSPEPAATVRAEGNAFTGGLRFQPPEVTVGVGQLVRWTNVDALVPHTASEDHGLWDLTGTYGQTPANPPGFGPGDSRERPFEAGTHKYFCKVHPAQMRGVVAVPARLERATPVTEVKPRRRRTRRRLLLTWATAPPAEGLVFDVEIRHADGPWRSWRTGSTRIAGSFRTQRRKEPWSARARLRSASDPSAATEWSPVAAIRG